MKDEQFFILIGIGGLILFVILFFKVLKMTNDVATIKYYLQLIKDSMQKQYEETEDDNEDSEL